MLLVFLNFLIGCFRFDAQYYAHHHCRYCRALLVVHAGVKECVHHYCNCSAKQKAEQRSLVRPLIAFVHETHASFDPTLRLKHTYLPDEQNNGVCPFSPATVSQTFCFLVRMIKNPDHFTLLYLEHSMLKIPSLKCYSPGAEDKSTRALPQ